MNHFEFYGIPVALSVDEAAVRRAYLLNSRKFHPDFHTLAGTTEQTRALEFSTQNNDAFKTLSDPDKRLRYVLEIKGLIGTENENPIIPQDFLMEMMDINEALMELEFDFDSERYARTMQSVNQLEMELETGIRPILQNWNANTGTEAELLSARDFFFKRRYLLRIKENLSKFAPAN